MYNTLTMVGMVARLIIDGHAHVRPSLKDLAEWDYSSVAEINREMQKRVYDSGVRGKPEIRRVNDDAIDNDAWKVLWDEKRWRSWEGIRDVDFRVKQGRCFWRKNGTEYYMDLAILNNVCDPNLLVSLMDEIGVDKAVIQTTPATNKYVARVANRYPTRLLGLCGVGGGNLEEKIEELRMYVGQLELKGVYGSPPFEDKYDPWWKEVSSLEVPVHIEGSLPAIKRLLEKSPSLTLIIVHGLQRRELSDDSARKMAVDIVKNYDVYLEILAGLTTKDYDVRYLYETFGPSKLVWGSEFVQVPKHYGPRPTAEIYAYRLHYLEKNYDFLTKNDLSLILGGNVQRIYRI